MRPTGPSLAQNGGNSMLWEGYVEVGKYPSDCRANILDAIYHLQTLVLCYCCRGGVGSSRDGYA